MAFGACGGGPAPRAVATAMYRGSAGHRVDALVTTGDNVYERGEPQRFAAQLDRPYQKLRRTRPLWVTLGNHQPAWSCSVHGSNREVDRWWVPVLERYRVALVLNGHDHNYQRFVSAGGVNYVVTGGGGKDLYPVTRCPSGTPRRVAAAARNHFTAVEVRPRSLTVRAVGGNGQVIDRVVIRR